MARITRMTKRRLGELLQAEGLLTEEQLRAGLEEQRKSNLFLGEALVKLGFVSEEIIAHTIVQQFTLPFMSANQYQVTPDVLNTFAERMYYEYQFIAVDKIGRTLIIVGAGLMNHDVLDELERISSCKVCQFVSTWKDIRGALEKYAKDFKKEDSELTSLGSMLIESAIQARPAAIAAAAASTSAPAPDAAKPATAPPPVIRANKSALSPAVPGPAPVTPGPATSTPNVAPRSVFSSQKPGTATPGIKSAGPQTATPSTPPVPPKTSALVGVKPGGAAPDSGRAPAVPPPGSSTGNPAAPKTGTGLLGLFKKQ